MTVIAYKAGRMACDSLCADTESGEVWYKGNKIHRTKVGGLIGCSGAADARALLALLENVKTGKQMPPSAQFCDTRVEGVFLIVLPDGDVWSSMTYPGENGSPWQADVCRITGMGGMAVAGCGGALAMTAMRAGKSAKEACFLACELNVFCRPPIFEEQLHPVKAPKKRGVR